ncbi:MAG: ribulose-phosphate 3-epimerase [Alphaproteobacteria bacterium]|nr:ribulose-phosphate 3-epimerase [Alphaproteobacteria bacterium]
MNMFDSSFLCLDIGTSGVRGIAHHVKSARIAKSAVFSIDSTDTVFAIKSVVDELEKQLGVNLDSAYITGNFGPSKFDISAKNTIWNGEHKISQSDIQHQIAQIVPPDEYYRMHIIPLAYSRPGARDMLTPVGSVDKQLTSIFGSIFYQSIYLDEIYAILRRAFIQPIAFYDPQFVQNYAFRPRKQTTMFIDLGAEFTGASIWTDRGPVWHTKIAIGGKTINDAISSATNITPDEADRIKRSVASMIPKEMDRFTPADTAYGFSRGDINDIVLPIVVDLIAKIQAQSSSALSKYKPTKIVLTGGGSEMDGIRDFFENTFGIPTEIMHSDASVRALSAHIWNMETPHRQKFLAWAEKRSRLVERLSSPFRRKKRTRQPKFIPILPSTLCFNMKRPDTYSLFKSGGISMIHVDIMDGFYVDRIAGSIDQIKFIRAHTNAHLHVHLMTESPTVWAADAINAGADTIILSTNTSGVRAALRGIRAAGKRAGIALNPESSVSILKEVLRDIDEVMVMTVSPGAAGQEFQPSCLHKISVLAATRKKYGLKFLISVDGGINDKTAQMCWDAGADLLVSGSYLSRAPDFPLAVHSLLKKTQQ